MTYFIKNISNKILTHKHKNRGYNYYTQLRRKQMKIDVFHDSVLK